MIEKVKLAAPKDYSILIEGASGTGKELIVDLIHELSSRKNKPLIKVNCSALPETLFESELFGHEKGSFTSAHKQRKGKFELANDGTLFLDEIGDMSLNAQAKMLRALQENKITRVGGDKDIQVSVRIITATNQNLQELIVKKKFREDLYHRLSVIIIKLPNLNERGEDISLLSKYFLKQICNEYKIPEKKISDDAINELQKKKWTGNIRELRNTIERLIILSKKEIGNEEVEKFVN